MSEQLLGASGQPRPNRHLHLRKCQPARRRRSAFCWERNPRGTFVRVLASVNPGARWTHRQRLRRPHSTPHAKRLMQEVPGFSAPRNWEMPLVGEAGLQTAGDLLKKKKKTTASLWQKGPSGALRRGDSRGTHKNGTNAAGTEGRKESECPCLPTPTARARGGWGWGPRGGTMAPRGTGTHPQSSQP